MKKTYKVKEVFYTLQGEGHHSGRAAVFCRFAGCNLWSGLEKDRASAICKFCDTDFWGIDGIEGGKYTANELADRIDELFLGSSLKYVVCTGGEPALQLDEALINALHDRGFEIAIETNGTISLAEGIDWICVSPKADTEIIVNTGHELKLVYPQKENLPSQFENLNFEYFYLQPLDDTNKKSNIDACVSYCKQSPKWKLSMQMHKEAGIP